MSYSLNELYRTVGVSKQAVHQARKRQESFDQELPELVFWLISSRKNTPGVGLKRCITPLNPEWMGRDKFCEDLSGTWIWREADKKLS
jgi:putative transposase